MKYGWTKDKYDSRDFKLTLKAPTKLPSKVDLRLQCPKVYDQGDLGSCTANAIGSAIEFNLIKEKKTDFVPSRLFIYYNERAVEGTINQDAGALLRDGIKVVAKFGVPDEKIWPYIISKFTKKPSTRAFTVAKMSLVTKYARVSQTLVDIQTVLSQGFPVVFGFTVYASFESDAVAKTGLVPMPTLNEEVLGGHAVKIVGYDNATKCFIVKNSWGPAWGDKGYFYMPYDYVLDPKLCDDFWAINFVN